MYWWHIAATKTRHGDAKRFGFITTNSLRQAFNRRVLEPLLNDGKRPLSIAFAIPDHPWVDSNDGPAVRIAMSVGAAGDSTGTLRQVVHEHDGGEDVATITMNARSGKLFADLSVGANVASAQALKANQFVSAMGVKLHGAGFIVSTQEASALGLGSLDGLERIIRNYRNGRDLTQNSRSVMVIDLYGL